MRRVRNAAELAKMAEKWGYNYQQIDLGAGVSIPGYDRGPLMRRIARRWDFEGQRVIDVGCYLGYFTLECARAGARAIGIDVSEKRISCARTIESFLRTGAEFHASRWPAWQADKYAFLSYDVVLAINVIHHFKTLNDLVRLAQVAEKRLFIELPLFKPGKHRPQDLLKKQFHRRAHQSALHPDKLVPFLQSLGFSVLHGSSTRLKGPRCYYDCRR